MATERTEDTRLDDDTLKQYYYGRVYSTRLEWTDHRIPVRARDPRTGFFIECYLSVVPIPKSLDQKVLCETAFLFTYSNNEILVPIRNIFPSLRHLTKTQVREKTVVDFGTKQVLPPGSMVVTVPRDNEFDPVSGHPATIETIKKVYDFYKGLSFTKRELESIINTQIPEDLISDLEVVGKRGCLITHEISDSYALRSEKKEQQKEMSICSSLPELSQKFSACTACELGKKREARGVAKTTGSRLGVTLSENVPSIPTNTIMLIGEAPGVQEEQTGLVFYPEAPAGNALDRVLDAAGIDKSQVYYANAVMCRPPSDTPGTQNGKPAMDHIRACSSRLKNELAIVSPKIVVLLGKVAYQAFFGTEPRGVLNQIGWLDDAKTIYLVMHPSYVVRELSSAPQDMRNEIKEKYLENFKRIKKQFDSLSS